MSVPVASAVTSTPCEIVGAVVSVTVTWNEPGAVLPLASVAVQLTVVVPTGNFVPELGVQLTVGFGSCVVGRRRA